MPHRPPPRPPPPSRRTDVVKDKAARRMVVGGLGANKSSERVADERQHVVREPVSVGGRPWRLAVPAPDSIQIAVEKADHSYKVRVSLEQSSKKIDFSLGKVDDIRTLVYRHVVYCVQQFDCEFIFPSTHADVLW